MQNIIETQSGLKLGDRFPDVLVLFIAILMRETADRKKIAGRLIENGYNEEDVGDAIAAVCAYVN